MGCPQASQGSRFDSVTGVQADTLVWAVGTSMSIIVEPGDDASGRLTAALACG